MYTVMKQPGTPMKKKIRRKTTPVVIRSEASSKRDAMRKANPVSVKRTAKDIVFGFFLKRGFVQILSLSL